MEEKLLSVSPTTAIINCFRSSKKKSFESILEPLQKLLRLSPQLAHAVGKPEFFSRILEELSHNKAVVRLNLLRILRTICDASEQKESLIRQYGMYQTVQRLAERDGAVLVRNLAAELIKLCVEKDKKKSYRQGSRRQSSISFSSSILPPSRQKSDLLSFWGHERETNDRNPEDGLLDMNACSDPSRLDGSEKRRLRGRTSSGSRTSNKYVPRRNRTTYPELPGWD